LISLKGSSGEIRERRGNRKTRRKGTILTMANLDISPENAAP
jgi:hypothetical protein